MSILGRIDDALFIYNHTKSKKSRKRDNANNREAGTIDETNKVNTMPSSNSTDNHRKSSNDHHNDETKKDDDIFTLDTKREKKKNTEKHSPKAEQKIEAEVETPTEAPKTEQQIKAEAEAPAEAPGAERIKTENEAADLPVACMSTPVHIAEPQPGVINMNGVVINTKDVMQRPEGYQSPSQMVNPAVPVQQPVQMVNPAVPIQQPVQMVNPNPYPAPHAPAMGNPNFVVPPTGAPMVPQNAGINLNPIPGMDLYAQRMTPGMGNHKVDYPAIKPPKPPKAEPDKIDMTGMPHPGNAMDVQNFSVIDARTHGIIESTVSKRVDKIELKSVFPSNAEMYKEAPYLEEIEKVALDNGYQIGFSKNPVGLIHCHVANAEGKYIDNKGFTIDPGLIIDQRKKVFPAIACFYEGMNAYPLFINSGSNKDKKEKKQSSNVFNEELIKSLIVGGNDTASSFRGMYTEEYRNLNTIVALITIPTKNNSPSDRKYIQNRLVDVYKAGVFNEALALNPNARFRVVDYNSGTGTIILDNFMVVKNFGGQYYGQSCNGEHIQFKITKDRCKMLRGENLINIDYRQ